MTEQFENIVMKVIYYTQLNGFLSVSMFTVANITVHSV